MNSNREPEQLPEGVIAWGWRYRVKIKTRNGTHILPEEHETPEAAHVAFIEAQAAQWNG
jgi:hypothetical protein